MTWYQNNSIHLFSLASLVANLIVNRRLKLEEEKLLKIIETLLPYIEKELSTRFSSQEIDNTIEFLVENGLIEKEGNAFKPPSRADSRYESLDLLAKILSPTVERMFITLNLIVLGKQNINSIGNESKKIARKITRLYGINSPDFFDSSVFDSFMAELIKRGTVQILEDGLIVGNSLIQNIARHADGVISPQIRQAISQAASPR